jgi:hypothetical protein
MDQHAVEYNLLLQYINLNYFTTVNIHTFSVLPDLIASRSADLVSGTLAMASTGLLTFDNSICGGGGGGGAAFISGGGGGINE